MWLGQQTVSSIERCPLFRVSFIERFHYRCLGVFCVGKHRQGLQYIHMSMSWSVAIRSVTLPSEEFTPDCVNLAPVNSEVKIGRCLTIQTLIPQMIYRIEGKIRDSVLIKDFAVKVSQFRSKSGLSRLGEYILWSENFANLAKLRKS